LRTNVLQFYASATSASIPPKEKKRWEKTEKELDQLKNVNGTAENWVPPADQGIDLLSGD